MGDNQVTIQNLEIIKVELEENCLLVKGSVPGANKSLVIVKSAVKTDEKSNPFDVISYETIEESTPVVEEIATEEIKPTEETKEEVTEETSEVVSE